MIKRRFFKQEHGDKDVPSDSSSSSDSELDSDASVDSEEEDDSVVVESRKKDQPSSSSSGYESEDSSGNDVNLDESDDDDDSEDETYKKDIIAPQLSSENHSDVVNNTHNIEADIANCVLKSKSVFKCKLCPRIVCLTQETLNAHLKSKRHARSEKLLREGRLKMMLNNEGEIEGEESDGETHQERHAKTLALVESIKKSKKNKGRQRQRKRKTLKKKTPDGDDDLKSKSTNKSPKKRRKSDV